jgi:hypothetical protein
MRTIEARQASIAARAVRIKELERRMAEHAERINETLAAIRLVGRR